MRSRRIKSRVEALLAEVASQTLSLDFDAASDSLSDGMNEYVHQLKFDGKKMWTQKDIQFSIRKDGFTVHVGRQKMGKPVRRHNGDLLPAGLPLFAAEDF